jgi:DNA-binding NtrC family response regulator
VLVAGDDSPVVRELAALLSRSGCSAQAVTSASELVRLAGQNEWEILLTTADVDDARLATLLSCAGSPAWLHLATAAPAGAGRAPYSLLEPTVRPEHLVEQVGRALEQRALEHENRALRASWRSAASSRASSPATRA